MQDNNVDIAQLVADKVDDMAAELAEAGILFPAGEREQFVEDLTNVVLGVVRIYLTGYKAALNIRTFG